MCNIYLKKKFFFTFINKFFFIYLCLKKNLQTNSPDVVLFNFEVDNFFF